MVGLWFLWVILIGVSAGAIAGWITKGKGSGFIINLLVGIAGSFLGQWIYGFFGLSSNGSLLGVLLMSVVGAVVLLWIISLFRTNNK